jgi:nicotinamide-nucleotide amidase
MDRNLANLAAAVGAKVRGAGLMLATAESCTGGLIAAAITETAGASNWFERGFVTYSNRAKEDMLGVPEDVLEKFGAVSEQTAQAMAQGALRNSRAQIAVAITGVAGPGGGTDNKPVGMVCFAWALSHLSFLETKHFSGGREAVRLASAEHALRGVQKILEYDA